VSDTDILDFGDWEPGTNSLWMMRWIRNSDILGKNKYFQCVHLNRSILALFIFRLIGLERCPGLARLKQPSLRILKLMLVYRVPTKPRKGTEETSKARKALEKPSHHHIYDIQFYDLYDAQ